MFDTNSGQHSQAENNYLAVSSTVDLLAQIAARCAANGYFPVALHPGSKRPFQDDWNTWTDWRNGDFDRAGLVGLRCGDDGLFAIDDFNCETIVPALRWEFLDSPCRVGKRGFVLLCRWADGRGRPGHDLTYVNEVDGRRAPIQIKSRGQFAAYGVHPESGRLYDWEGQRGPLNTPVSDLPTIESTDQLLARIDSVMVRFGFRRPPIVERSPGESAYEFGDVTFDERLALGEWANQEIDRAIGELGRMSAGTGRGGYAHGLGLRVGPLFESARQSEIASQIRHVTQDENSGKSWLSGCEQSAGETVEIKLQALRRPAALLEEAKARGVAVTGFNPSPTEVPALVDQGGIDVDRFRLKSICDAKLSPRDYLLGDVLCTTSRWLINGETGVGKTLFGLEMAAAVASGSPFLNWQARRNARVLYLDGELPRETLQERAMTVRDRYGEDVDLFVIGRDFLEQSEDIPPLNTADGVTWLWRRIAAFKPDMIVFDSIMCLLGGNMAEEQSWEPTKHLVRQLTSARIAQVWLHHTGHDATKGFGTKTREWEMDTVVMLSKAEGADGDRAGAEFNLEFTKSRLKTPKNFRQFEARVVRVGDNGFMSQEGTAPKGKAKSSGDIIKESYASAYVKLAEKVTPTPDTFGRPVRKVEHDEIRLELMLTGRLPLTERGNLTDSARKALSRARHELMSTGRWGEDGTLVWRIEEERNCS